MLACRRNGWTLAVALAAPFSCGERPLSLSDGGSGGTLEIGPRAADAAEDVPVSGDSDAPGADAPNADAPNADAPGIEAPSADRPDGVVARRPYHAIAIATGRYHSCALLDDHGVKCWGLNVFGALGLGDSKARGLDLADMGDALPKVDLGTGRTAKAIAAGRYGTCAILDTDALKCWGLGSLTGLDSRATNRGDQPGQMGDALPAVDLGPGRTAKRIAIGHFDACVQRDDETLRCWGTSNPPTETPVEGRVVAVAGAASVLALLEDGRVARVGPGFMMILPLDRPARGVAGSRSAACALMESGRLSCGDGPSAGVPPPEARIAAVAISEFRFFAAVLLDGTLRSWSPVPMLPMLPLPAGDAAGGTSIDVGQPVTATSSGAWDHTCVLLADGGVKCWSWSGMPIAAVGAGPDNGLSPGRWAAVDLGTRPN